MEFVIGVVGMAILVGLYVGLGLADRHEDGCGDCALHGPGGDGCTLYGGDRDRSTCPTYRIEQRSNGSSEP